MVLLVQTLLPQNNWPKKNLLYDLPILSLLHGKLISQSAQSLSRVQPFATPWMAACLALLSITNSRSLLKLISIMSINHLILCRPLLLLPSILPSIREVRIEGESVSQFFSNESVLHIRWPKYWSFNFSISPSSEYSGLICFRMDWLDLLAVQGTFKSLLQHGKGNKNLFWACAFCHLTFLLLSRCSRVWLCETP